MKLSETWAFFDKIYCISIDNRDDRRIQASMQFSNVGLDDGVEFVIVSKHHENPEKGIFQSHIHCLKKGLETGAETILIFEDDVFFQGFDEQAFRRSCIFLDTQEDWNGLFLGCITSGSSKTTENTLVKIKYRCLAHAYALNRSFAKRIAQEHWKGIPFDALLQKYQSDFFAVHPMFAFQRSSKSDNRTVFIDQARRFFGGLVFIQKANELYQNHKLPLVTAHLAVLILLGALVFKLW